jgi:hypothetical protein
MSATMIFAQNYYEQMENGDIYADGGFLVSAIFNFRISMFVNVILHSIRFQENQYNSMQYEYTYNGPH